MKDSWWMVCFEPVLWSLVPLGTLQGAWVLLHQGDGEALSLSFLLLAHYPDNEDLALAVHTSVSIPASLQVVACSGVIHWYLLNPFLYHFLWSEVFNFMDLGHLRGDCHLIGNVSLWGMCCGRVRPLLHCSPWTNTFHMLWVLSAKGENVSKLMFG